MVTQGKVGVMVISTEKNPEGLTWMKSMVYIIYHGNSRESFFF